ncbi:cytochrome b5 domain containing 1 [Homo sapiens]|uniref:Cytochrome b5 domain containing 1 n=4 Tax=Homininae TaxID=207598 RepID=I3NI34_HUMAN|nr:cytochrome b5 domain containing 1 [Homo sapiens]
MPRRGLVAGPDLEYFQRRYFTPAEVGVLESIWEILHRYLPYNSHAASYTWKYEGKNLNMDFTLEENGIRDEEEEFDYLSMDGTLHTPAILLYFNDDLTEL